MHEYSRSAEPSSRHFSLLDIAIGLLLARGEAYFALVRGWCECFSYSGCTFRYADFRLFRIDLMSRGQIVRGITRFFSRTDSRLSLGT